MADNTTLNAGTGGDVLRTDDVGGSVKVPVSKIITGGDGVDGGFVGLTNPWPVILCSGSDTIGTTTNPVNTRALSGSVMGLLVGGVAVSNANPVPSAAQSGSVMGLLVGGVAVSQANPVPSAAQSGSVMGLLVGGVAVSNANPVPSRPQSGSVTGLLVGGVAASRENPVPTAISAEPATQILSGSTFRTVYHAFGAFSTSGSANQIVPPAGSGNRIAVLSAHLMVPASAFVRFQSTGSAGTITNISGRMPVPANGGFVLPHNPHAWFKTAANEGLNLEISAAVECGVIITWTIFNNP